MLQLSPLEYLERFVGGHRGDGDAARAFLRTWVAHGASDAQMAAWMADIAHAGLNDEGVYALVSELIASGDRLELASLGATGTIVSTGALGDVVMPVAASLAATLGVRVVCVAEPAVGWVGSARDLLTAIPGYRGPGDVATMVQALRRDGCVVTSELARIAPAERRLGSVRDQTGQARTVEMIAASAVARALAVGTEAAVIHVPFGPGAQCPDAAAAERIERIAAAFADAWGRRIRVVATPVPAMLSPVVGQALQVREMGALLRGEGSPSARTAVVEVAQALVDAADVADDAEPPRSAGRALAMGEACEVAERWVEAHGGDRSVWSATGAPATAPLTRVLDAPRAGRLALPDPSALGEAMRRLGVGRLHPDQSVDPGVGVAFHVMPGEAVCEGEPVATIYGRDQWLTDRAHDDLADAIQVERA